VGDAHETGHGRTEGRTEERKKGRKDIEGRKDIYFSLNVFVTI
jgi:hypothetical protein